MAADYRERADGVRALDAGAGERGVGGIGCADVEAAGGVRMRGGAVVAVAGVGVWGARGGVGFRGRGGMYCYIDRRRDGCLASRLTRNTEMTAERLSGRSLQTSFRFPSTAASAP